MVICIRVTCARKFRSAVRKFHIGNVACARRSSMAILNSVFILPARVLSALLYIVMMDHAHFAATRRDENVLSCPLNPSAYSFAPRRASYIDFLDARLFMHPPFCKHIAYRVESSCVGRVFYKYLVALIFLFLLPTRYLNFFYYFFSY